ncbi:hypothetical protein ACHAWX_001250 [Stephanocyclus meneghinianus]
MMMTMTNPLPHLFFHSIPSLATKTFSKTNFPFKSSSSSSLAIGIVNRTIHQRRPPPSPPCFSFSTIARQERHHQRQHQRQRRPLHRSSHTNSPRRPLRAAVIGSGPSGFYAAKYLTSSVSKRVASLNDNSSAPWPFSGVEIDILERLPTPFGLVRYGVAPDHPEVKHVQNDFAAVSSSDAVSYFGNVEAGRDDVVSLSTLSSLYDVVVLAYGCQSDRGLEIPGRNLRGVLTAREFVNWYNGHPEYGYVGETVREARGGNAVVVGNGNVALDCARILAKGREGLRDTDAPGGVLEVLGEGMERVVVAGRRGHVQGAFTIKELRELTKLRQEGYGVAFRVRREELDMGMTESSLRELQLASGRPKTRIDALLREAAATAEKGENGESSRRRNGFTVLSFLLRRRRRNSFSCIPLYSSRVRPRRRRRRLQKVDRTPIATEPHTNRIRRRPARPSRRL